MGLTRPGAAAVAALAVAAGTAIAVFPFGTAKPAPVATQTTAYVVSHVVQALDAMPDNTVVFTQQMTVPASNSGRQADVMHPGTSGRPW
jgi:hypothetical protein